MSSRGSLVLICYAIGMHDLIYQYDQKLKPLFPQLFHISPAAQHLKCDRRVRERQGNHNIQKNRQE